MKAYVLNVIVSVACMFTITQSQNHGTISVRIVGGRPAKRGEFPHIIQIIRNGQQSCAGSIVSVNWILTAAHCAVYPIQSYTIVAGEHNVGQNGDTNQIRSVDAIIIHPNYNRVTLANDVALMRINLPFNLTSNVRVRATVIPRSKFTPSQRLRVAGWGALSYAGNGSTVLMRATVPFVSIEDCKKVYGRQIFEGMLCAGTGYDSGGPLMSRSILVGIVSWGHKCGVIGYPGVYTSVPYFSSWINRQIA